jgi:hypothetical protein
LAASLERRPQFLAVVSLRNAHRRAQIGRLHKNRVAQRRLDPGDGLARRAFPLGPEQRYVPDEGQFGLGEEPLHYVLVHARRRAQHAGADVGDPGQLEEPLDGPILAKGSVQHGKDHVQALAVQAGLAALRRVSLTRARLCRSRALQQPLRSRRGQPMPGLVDANRHHLELPAINRLQNRSRREQRNLMLAAPPAKKNSHSQFFCHCSSF